MNTHRRTGHTIINPRPPFWTIIAVLTLVITSPIDGGAEPTNQLANASSPYLREAASQPVAWYPWGEEAFRLAKELDRPILMDIGAIWCHWCHVMDHETYSDPEVAQLINNAFIAIRVDRDERPDIDARYQQAVQAITGHGGWPLTVFMTPEGKVFYGGGTFFPDDRFGRPGFKKVLPKLAALYRDRRETILTSADELYDALSAREAERLRKAPLSPHLVDVITQSMVRLFDEEHGGFGPAVKFPHSGAIELALRTYAEKGDKQMLRIATKTLDEMAKGGIHDQLGGGFHRYATDRGWRIPHFEKFTTDNALLLMNYLHAYKATGNARYREIAEGIIGYTQAFLSDQERGGFYADQDADVGRGDDGSYYTWTLQEVKAALSKEEAEVLIRYYAIDAEGDMRETPGRNVVWVATTPDQIARDLSLPVRQVKALIASGKTRLTEARRKRERPFVNQTLFADRNGMMVSAYLEADKILGREDLKVFGLKSLDVLLPRIYSREEGLYHALSEGKPHTPGFLSDYVWVTAALLQALQVTGDARYLKTARQVMDEALRSFWDETGQAFFDFRPNSTALGLLKQPSKSFVDTPIPSPNAMAALVLNQLYLLTNANVYHQRAEQILETFASAAPEAGPFASAYALAVDLHLHPAAHAAIIGPRSDPRTLALWQAALTAFRPGKIVVAYDPALEEEAELPPPIAAAVHATRAKGTPQAFVCVGVSCSLPLTEPEAVTALVQTYKRQIPR